jgi:hypothetical protein
VEAIRANLLAIADVTACVVLENTGDVADGDGIPPHAVLAVVLGATTAEIAAVLWERKGGGIYLHGTTSTTILDSQGITQPVRFSRPTSKLMWVKLTYSKNAEKSFPVDGVALMKAAALEYGQEHTIGEDVLPVQFVGPVTEACAGIKTLLVEVALDSGGSPGAYQSTPYTISHLELASFDSGRITTVEV